MKLILNLCLMSGLLFGQEVHFSFYEHTTQRFEIPFDTTFRAYKAPYDLIETGQSPMLQMIFNGCHNREFHIDNIRFPSNAYINFEEDLPELTTSVGISQALLVEHPSDSGFVLHIEFDSNHLGVDTLRISQPDSWYPVVPDLVGLEFQADASIQFNKYFKPPELARYDVNVDDWGFRTVLAEKYNETTTVDLTINTVRRHHFRTGGSHEVYVIDQTYTNSNARQNILDLDEMIFDFELPIDEYAGGDTSWGSFLSHEYYQEVFGEITFVKIMSPFGPIGHNLHFAYGVGLIREDFPGTSVHADLVGLQDQGEVRGDMNLPVSLSLGVNLESPGIQIFPPDTNWYHYTIPVSDLHRYPPMPTTSDSLRLILTPQILVRNHDSGALLFNGISLWSGQDIRFDYGTLNHNEWHFDSALNGSDISWGYSQNAPPDSTGPSSLLQFSNGWVGGLHFVGWAEHTVYFSTPLINANTSLQFWMKQPLIMTNINEYAVVIPDEMGVLNAYPNPFNGEVALIIRLAEDVDQQELSIYDLKGRRIRTIKFEGAQRLLEISWRGDDQSGHLVASGVYLATLSSKNQPVGEIQKIIMLK